LTNQKIPYRILALLKMPPWTLAALKDESEREKFGGGRE
jgi:hypothetical protein